MEGLMNIMNFKDIIKQSILDNFTGDITPEKIAVVLLAAFTFGVYIFFVYRVAVSNEFYSKDFNKTLTLMAVTTAAIVLSIQANLIISLGMVGALSIVRFRTAVKSTLDLFFLYWAISVGIICGAGLYLLAGVASVIITIIIFALEYIQSPVALSILVIQATDLNATKEADTAIKEIAKFSRIKNKTISKNNVECIWEIKIKEVDSLEKKLSEIDGINSFSFMSFDRETRI